MTFLAIVMVCYNEAPHLDVVLDSVLTQDFADFRLIFVDNGSTDGSGELPGRRGDRRILPIHTSANRAHGWAVNTGVELACMAWSQQPEWVLVHNADDLMLPGYLRRIHEVSEERPEANCIFSPWSWIQGTRTEKSFPPYDASSICDVHQIPGLRAVRRDFWFALGGEDEQIYCGSDWDWAVRASLTGTFVPYQLERPYIALRERGSDRRALSDHLDWPRLNAHMKRHTRDRSARWQESAA